MIWNHTLVLTVAQVVEELIFGSEIMDSEIDNSIHDIRESFEILTRLNDPLRDIPDIENWKEIHKNRIKCNLESLMKKLEELE